MVETSHIVVYILVVVVTSVLIGYLSDVSGAGARADKNQTVEGFQGTDENMEGLNEAMNAKVTNLEDALHVNKYKKSYENTLVYGTDYLDAMKVSMLFKLKGVVDAQNDKDKMVELSVDLAKKLGALDQGAKALKETTLP